MNNSMINIRQMKLSDLPSIMLVQAASYSDIIPESANSMLAKLLASPSTCFVAIQNDKVIGYLISLPWEFSNPPALNMQYCTLPSHPDCLYLHDLAIDPTTRKSGAAPALVKTFLNKLAELGFNRASLIAIQNSASYWRRYGFEIVEAPEELNEKITSYGEDTFYMVKSS